MNPALERPFVWISYQIFSQRIFPDVHQFVLILNPVTHAMVKCAALPLPGLIKVISGKPTFPKSNPLVDAKLEIEWCAEQVKMVGHQQIIPNEPAFCLVAPELGEGHLDWGLIEPWLAVLGIYG